MNKDTGQPAQTLHTEGGAVTGGNVHTGGGDFTGRDKIVINVTWQLAPFALPEPDLEQTRAAYLAYLRATYQHLDFKGLPQVDKIAQQLPLDAVYVPLRARPDVPAGETWLRVAGRAFSLDDGDDDASRPPHAPAHGHPMEPVLADAALATAPALVILGDPGAGKSTLLKVLALALAREPAGPLPILAPLAAYAAELAREEISLHDFLVRYFGARQHCLADCGALFDAALQAGQAVVLLDGLDEVQARRGFLVGLVQDFAREYIPQPDPQGEPAPGNRLVVASRIVGYREAPLNGARWRTYTLVDWGRDEITRFAARWTLAFEIGTHGDTGMAREAARQEQADLLAAIFANPGIERLASNPLLLTILALIKRQGVTLPQRRVKLYERYLETLIHAWNQARALDRRPVGPELDYLETVQVLAPLALWLRETHPTAGLVTRPALEGWLTAYFKTEWGLATGPARKQGRDFLKAVRTYSNLLIERGPDQYGFLHLTFEEMLAAKGIAARAQLGVQDARDVILAHLDDPAWHETILLAVGALGVVTQQPLAAGTLVQQLCQAPVAGENRGAPVVLAGEAVLDVGEAGVGRRAAAKVTAQLVATLQDARVALRTRRAAGLVLGQLGWQPADLDAFVLVPPGPFRYGDERPEPRHIAHPYAIGKYPVTNAQYARFIAAGGYAQERYWSQAGWQWKTERRRRQPYYWDDLERSNPIFPVVGVAYYEAAAYCAWLETWLAEEAPQTWRAWLPEALHTSERLYVRLPTEEVWERAARGADGRAYPWGPNFNPHNANTKESGRIGTTAVCTYPQGVSPTGAWDMSGNVWEWTATPDEDWAKVVRGGSYWHDASFARCGSRPRLNVASFNSDVGFRVMVSLVSSGSEC